MLRIEFSPETRSAIIPIERPKIIYDLASRALRDGFQEKDEFHVTVLPSVDKADISDEDIDRYRALVDGAQINDLRIINSMVYRLWKPKMVIEEGESVFYERESIIVRARSLDVLRVLDRMGTAHGFNVPYPFLHATLFTKGDEPYASKGIGIATPQEFYQTPHEPYPPSEE
jgi:hypothetical protein